MITPARTTEQSAVTESLAQQVAELTRRNAALVEALQALVELGGHVPVFQLDECKSSVKAVRLAGKFMAAMDKSRAALAEDGT